MPQIIKQEENKIPLTKGEEYQSMRAHLHMMLEAMQYKGSTKHMGLSSLRDLVEEQKLIFIRKIEAQNERSQ